jgi:CheY-like chemotaxis protein
MMASVLIVDDNEDLAETVALMLQHAGYEVRTASNGLHGYSSYFRKPTDWVVTDIQMPELDGVEMMQCIRAVNPSVKAIYMSGAVEKFRDKLDQERKQYAARVLDKPFTRTALLSQIAAA